MDSRRQPTIWGNHNLSNIAGEAFRRNTEREKAQAVNKALTNPDNTEECHIYIDKDKELYNLSRALITAFGPKLASQSWGGKVDAKLFRPHDSVVDSSQAIDIDVHTSVVAFDTYIDTGDYMEKSEKTGSAILFKLSANLIGEPTPDMTANDLIFGDNCTYGALVDSDTIKYFKITYKNGDIVESELRRKDPTEQSGQSVDAQIIKRGDTRLVTEELSPSSNEALELDQELEKFIKSRQ